MCNPALVILATTVVSAGAQIYQAQNKTRLLKSRIKLLVNSMLKRPVELKEMLKIDRINLPMNLYRKPVGFNRIENS